MSHRAVVVEDFDDDTDLPLPNKPLPNTGARGAILTAVSDDEVDLSHSDNEADEIESPGTLGQGQARGKAGPASPLPKGQVTDITPYKTWTAVYPIYLDAKQPYTRGARRLARPSALWWPLSKDIADAVTRLGLRALHEVNKSHPRDWANPGRVRVLWRREGVCLNPRIKSKKQLLEAISLQIQMVKPDLAPHPPYTYQSTAIATTTITPSPAKSTLKQKANSPSKFTKSAPPKQNNRVLPVSPEPMPPFASRLSAYSPLVPSGVLIDAVKAGMNAQDAAVPSAPGGAGKGKRKVVRVRG